MHNLYHLIHRNPHSEFSLGVSVGARMSSFSVCFPHSLCAIVNSLDFDPADHSQMYIDSSLLDHFTKTSLGTRGESCSCSTVSTHNKRKGNNPINSIHKFTIRYHFCPSEHDSTSKLMLYRCVEHVHPKMFFFFFNHFPRYRGSGLILRPILL